MTTKKTNVKNKPIIVQNIDIRQNNRNNLDITDWRNSIKAAESVFFPNRSSLYNIYEEIMLDAHLAAVVHKRLTSVSTANLVFNDNNNKPVDAINKLIKTQAFDYMVQQILLSKFWGHTLLELSFDNNNFQATLIPRKHVRPKVKAIVRNENDYNAILFYNQPPFDNFTLEAGDPDDLGLFAIAAQYIIYKRNCIGDWAQFAELFGMPLRIGKYDGIDEGAFLRLQQMLQNSASAAYMIQDENTKVEFVDTPSKTGSSQLYKDLVSMCNAEISKLILGNTLTTEQGDKGARALGEVHKQIEYDINWADQMFLLKILNSRFIELLNINGFKAKGAFAFQFSEEIPLTERIIIDMQLDKKIPIDDDYFYKTYNMPKPANYEVLKADFEAKKNLPLLLSNPDNFNNKDQDQDSDKDSKDTEPTNRFKNFLSRFFR